jgi:hypothetical protein
MGHQLDPLPFSFSVSSLLVSITAVFGGLDGGLEDLSTIPTIILVNELLAGRL